MEIGTNTKNRKIRCVTLLTIILCLCLIPKISAQCNSGYVISTTVTGGIVCTPCAIFITNCTNCNSTTVCTACDLGYTLNITVNATNCQPCGTPFPNCAFCNTTFCTECANGWMLSSGACTPCNLTYNNCLNCSPSACTICADGYFVWRSTICASCSTHIA